MSLTVENTKGRRREPFEPGTPGEVRMYVCGPSTYDHAHVGHGRSYLVYDVLRRYLEHLGYDVRHVMNFTDVSEAIGKRASKEGVGVLELAERYIDAFREDMDALHVRRPHATPRVSRYIDAIQDATQRLVDAGVAYAVDGNVYFDAEASDAFGEVAGEHIVEHTAGDATRSGERRHAQDFALWKSLDDWGITWDSPWGDGRPGWHIECTVMALDHLGPGFDVHGGGMDLIYPHHEAEAAIARELTGEAYCRYYLHNGFVTLQREKMSKSTGNYVQLRTLLADRPPQAVRAHLLDAPYRATLEYREGDLDAWEDRLDAWSTVVARLDPADAPSLPRDVVADRLPADLRKARDGFHRAMDDDLDLAGALDALGAFLEAADARLDGSGLGEDARDAAGAFARDAAGVLGLFWDEVPDAG